MPPGHHRRLRPFWRSALGAACVATTLVVSTGAGYVVAHRAGASNQSGLLAGSQAVPAGARTRHEPHHRHAGKSTTKAVLTAQLQRRPATASRSGIRNPVRADAEPPKGSTRSSTPRPQQVVPAGPAIARIPKKPKPPEPPEPQPIDPFTFRMGTFNVLGSQHTRGSSRWAAGTTRAGFTAGLVQGYGLDLVGFQEVQDDQLNVLNARLPGYSIWPSRALGNNGVRLQIAFRDSMFELVQAQSFITVFDHQYRPIPVVLLRNRLTGGEFYYMDIHNSPQGMVTERAAAKRVEIAHINALLATGKPVIVGGDMNEKAPFFCQVGPATGMVAANGGSPRGCVLPPPPVKIDWIMGAGGVSFSGYSLGAGGLVARASDHEFPHTTVTVAPSSPIR